MDKGGIMKIKKFYKKYGKYIKKIVKVLVIVKAVIEILDFLMKVYDLVSPLLSQGLWSIWCRPQPLFCNNN